MSLFSIDPTRQGRWQIPIILPAVLALVLVIAMAAQAVRSAQIHRRAVSAALRDYAAFAAWQYTRRASDYLRLTIGSRVWPANVRAGPFGPRGECAACAPVTGFVNATIQRTPGDSIGHMVLERNETPLSTAVLLHVFDSVSVASAHSGMQIGLVAIEPAQSPHVYLGYTFLPDSTGTPRSVTATLIDEGELLKVFDHVARFAPLLPPSFVGDLPNDTLVSVRVFAPGGALIAAIGRDVDGIEARDVLGPDLAAVRVVATLHPVAMQRLVAGGVPPANSRNLIAMFVVTLVLCTVAVVQMRRTHELIRLRNDFVASVSHELKTPLTQISLFAETLSSPRERTAAERRQYLNIITREAKRLGQLVDGILHFAGMTRHASSTDVREPAMLGEEIRAAITSFAPIADARAVTIETNIAQEVELPLERDAFRQVLLNLLDNALKYGPDGQRVVVSVAAGDDGAVLRVDDEGPGIPVGERVRVFDAFVRVDRGGATAGSGIGLAVVRDVVRRHGGTVSALGAPSGGTRIEIRLPDSRVVSHTSATADA